MVFAIKFCTLVPMSTAYKIFRLNIAGHMQINQQQCSSGASLDQAYMISCLCKLFVGSKMQELWGNEHLPSTQRRKTRTEVGKNPL